MMRRLVRVVVGLGLVVGLSIVAPPVRAQGVVTARGSSRVATAPGIPLGDTLVPATSGSPVIVPGNEATYKGKVIPQGLHYPTGSSFDFRLNKRYSRLVGTIYGDDAEVPGSGLALSVQDGSLADPSSPEIYRYVSQDGNERIHTFSINVQGLSVIAVSNPSTLPGGVEDIVAYLVPATPSFAPPTALAPMPNAVTPGGPLAFRWSAVPGAVAYYLQMWLVQPTSGNAVGTTSVTTTSLRVTGTSYTLPTAAYSRGAYHWRLASIRASGISPWGPEQTVTLH